MTELKREYVVPLRRKTKYAPKWRRSKKAVCVLKEFIQKHMKTDSVIICPELNEKVWENGIKNPPGKVSVVALKTQIGGIEKTLVNLVEVGVEKHLSKYNSQEVQAVEEPKKKNTVEKTEKKTEAKDVDVKEVETKKEDVEEVKKNG